MSDVLIFTYTALKKNFACPGQLIGKTPILAVKPPSATLTKSSL